MGTASGGRSSRVCGVVDCRCCSSWRCCSWAARSESGSTSPRQASGDRLSRRVLAGWMGSNSSVASLPASLRMDLAPPGWCGMKEVTWSRQSQQARRRALAAPTNIVDFAVENDPAAAGRVVFGDWGIDAVSSGRQTGGKKGRQPAPSAAENLAMMDSEGGRAGVKRTRRRRAA